MTPKRSPAPAARPLRALALLLLCATVARTAGAQDVGPVAVFLTWTGDPSTTVTVDWHLLPGSDAPHVEIRGPGLDGWRSHDGRAFPFPFSKRTVRRAELGGLRPDATYEIRFGDGTRSYRHRTMPASMTRSIRFAAGGDTRFAEEDFGRMNRVVATYDPDFVVFGGDLSYANGDPRSVSRKEQWFETITRTLVTADGRLIPALVGIGNHEVFSARRFDSLPAKDSLLRAYELEHGEAPYYDALFAQPRNHRYGVVDFGRYLSIVLLNTGHTAPVAGAQTAWLDTVLAARRDVPHLFPVYHVPGYPSVRSFDGATSRLVREHWVPLFERGDVRLAFENHDHAYKRTVPLRQGKRDPDGIVYVGDGSWGVGPREIGRDQGKPAWYLDVAKSTNHAIIVTVDPERRYLSVVDGEGTVIDEYAAPVRTPVVGAGRVRHVPARYPTIAAAIAAAADGDSVVVASGTYRESLVLSGKRITIISQAARAGAARAADSTIIDGGGAERVVMVAETQRVPVALVGLTIRNGEDCVYGHGIFHLIDSRVTGCTDGIDYDRTGGGIVRGSVFEGNRDDGIDLDHDVRALIEYNLIRDNQGDGIEVRLQPYTGDVAESTIRHNTIVGNREDGIQIIDYPGLASRRLVLVGNVIADNGQAGIGCMSDAVTREDFRAAVIPEPIVLEGNLLRGHQVELSCGGALARQRPAN